MKKLICSFLLLFLISLFSIAEAETGLISEGPPVYGNPYTGEIVVYRDSNVIIPSGWRYIMNSPTVYFVDAHPGMLSFPDGNHWWIEKRDLGLNTGVSWLRLLYVVDKNLTATYTWRLVGAIVNGKVITLATDDAARIACQYVQDSKNPTARDLDSPVDLSPIAVALDNAHLGVAKKVSKIATAWGLLKKGGSK